MSASEKTNKARAGQTYVMVSLGCKVNQAEASHLCLQLESMGFIPAPKGKKADLAVLMTCSVTASAGRQSRQMARRLVRKHAQAVVVATGCDVQAEPLAYTQEGARVVGRACLVDLPAMAAGCQAWPNGNRPDAPDSGEFCPGVRFPGRDRSRALLKVQDGCDAFCAYCIVPHTRGKPRSLSIDKALMEWRALESAGAAEVVLTGIHLGRYGQDLGDATDLTRLVSVLLAQKEGPRLRLSSLEVNEISDELLHMVATHPRLCRHLHIPLQSGCDQVLGAMGRPYNADEFAGTVNRLHAKSPDICLGADVLVGLPGEDQASFERTKALLESLPLSYFHVFPYSPRKGTPAANMKGRPKGPEVRERAAVLRDLGRQKLLGFLSSQRGKVLEAVMEGKGLARTDNYCLVKLPQGARPGSRLKVLTGNLFDLDGQTVLEGENL